MKLSIIVPVYNMASDGNLYYCLDSLVNHTISDFEIIAVDDASTDASPEILREYEKRYPDRFVALFLEKNHRQGGAKNAALRICKGEYVGFVDSDDWMAPDAYERLYQMARDQDADISGCDLCYVYEHGMEPGERLPSMDMKNAGELTPEKRKGLILQFGALVTKIYRRELFLSPELRFPEHAFYEDNAIYVELIMRAKKIAYVEEPFYFYLQHGTSTVHSISEERCKDRMAAMRRLIELAKEGGYLEEYRQVLECRFAELFYRNTLFSYMQGVKQKKLAFTEALGREMHETFPDFLQNPLFLARCDEEEKKLMAMQQKSNLKFYLYYQMLWAYRRMRR
ncbi:MAG: glycosyltransferase [Lachnospiraceae bacterium]|nr:glycosyltransferase [Lachnospiraceae bacterium]